MEDPRLVLDRQPMSRFQWIAVAVTVGLNALDGFDILSISFASPGIAKEWGIDRAALGIVLSMELIGMAVGSLVLGGVADRIGRRNTILLCLVAMAIGMGGAAFAGSITELSIWRVLTGLGIGGMLAATNAAVAEVSNAARRDLCVMLMASGYPIGAVIGGSISAALLQHYSWHAIFVFGSIATLCFIPLVLWRLPESIAFRIHQGRPDALEKVNATLARMGKPALDTLPPASPWAAKAPIAELFAPALRARTILLTAVYFTNVLTFYYLLKWLPKIVADLGFTMSSAAGVLVWANVGGAAGCVVLGLLSARMRILGLTAATMLLSFALVALFGLLANDLAKITLLATIAGFFTNASVVGVYALVARAFPTGTRASATGFVIGVGRGGSALAPIVAGFLFAGGASLAAVSAMMAAGALAAGVMLLLFRGALSGGAQSAQ